MASSFASSWLLWEAHWLAAAVVGLAPSMLVSAALLLARAELAGYAGAPIGRWVAQHMTPAATGIRVAGQIVMWAGAAAHVPWLLPTGLLVVVFGWMRGLWTPDGV